MATRSLLATTTDASRDPEAIVYNWLGGQIRNRQGGEYSAWGISSEAGGVLVPYAHGWRPIGQANLRKGDLIYSCGEDQVKDVEELARRIQAAPADQPLTLLVRRGARAGVKVVFPKRPPAPQAPK